MQKIIANSIASLLEAIPYQVELWDGRVIDRLARDPHLRNRFNEGDEEIKWDIYHSIKYGHSN